MTDHVLLRVAGLAKAYAGVHALSQASFDVRAGEVHALVGENGAGKSTLVKIITGVVTPDHGIVSLDGVPLGAQSPRSARAHGIVAIYQQPALFPELTVAENMALGVDSPGRWGRIDWRARRARAVELLARVGAGIDPEREAGDLSMPEQQLVEIARALGVSARLLIFDEPTASLSEGETRSLFDVIRQLRDGGVGILYISHRLEELSAIADRVTVLRDGTTVATHPMRDTTPHQLIAEMVGRELSGIFPKRAVKPGSTVLALQRVGCRAGGVRDVTLDVRAGEIVGIAGLAGAGRTELARTLFGLTPADRGEIHLRGQRVVIDTPARAMRLGLALVPEDRRRHGVVLHMPVRANMTLAALDTLSGPSGLDFDQEREIASAYVERLRIKTPSIDAAVSALSGGNQQKVALGRWLMTKPSVLILDEPTQGIDVGAKAEIHALMSELAATGVAILMISSDLPEILGMSDRIAVMAGGTIVRVLERDEATSERIMSEALGEWRATAV